MNKALTDHNFSVPSSKAWDPQRAYSRRMVTLMAKDPGQWRGRGRQAGSHSRAAPTGIKKAAKRARPAEESDADDEAVVRATSEGDEVQDGRHPKRQRAGPTARASAAPSADVVTMDEQVQDDREQPLRAPSPQDSDISISEMRRRRTRRQPGA